jgi:hypothetical protein
MPTYLQDLAQRLNQTLSRQVSDDQEDYDVLTIAAGPVSGSIRKFALAKTGHD